jgi:hypothetical protein
LFNYKIYVIPRSYQAASTKDTLPAARSPVEEGCGPIWALSKSHGHTELRRPLGPSNQALEISAFQWTNFSKWTSETLE